MTSSLKPTIPPTALSGFNAASSYDAHRPSYPSQSVDKLLDALHVAGEDGARILEIGAGTGKFTALLAARTEGFEIVSVEPHAEMRKVLLGKGLEGVKACEGSATELAAVEDGWADGVVVAQAFHWFANMDALHEIYKKLAPGGVLGMIWNIEDYNAPTEWEPATKWERKMKDIIWSHDDRDPRFRHKEWQQVFDDQLRSTPATIQAADPLFSLPLGRHEERWTVWLPSRQAIWDRFSTISHIAVLEGQQLEDTRKKVFEALEEDDVETNEKGEIALHGRTTTYWTSAIPGAPLRQGG